jgi:hypothetical protein
MFKQFKRHGLRMWASGKNYIFMRKCPNWYPTKNKQRHLFVHEQWTILIWFIRISDLDQNNPFYDHFYLVHIHILRSNKIGLGLLFFLHGTNLGIYSIFNFISYFWRGKMLMISLLHDRHVVNVDKIFRRVPSVGALLTPE